VFYRNKNVKGIVRRCKAAYSRLRYGLQYDWLDTFGGSSFGYNKLDPGVFSENELVVSMCAQTTLDAWSLPGNRGIKVLHCHGAEIENWEMMLESWRLPIPKIAISSPLAEMMRQETSRPVLGVVPNGIDTEEYFPCAPEFDRTGIGTILGASRPKDPDSAMWVMRALQRQLPGVPRYMFSGMRSHYRLDTIHFRMRPTIEEARRTYSSCRVWFLTSISEGFGLPILEAMACGCAVVSTKCSGPQDVIQDGVNGFLVDVGNTGAMVHRIVQLYQDEMLRNRISQNALRTAQQFTWARAADKLEQLLISIYQEKVGSTT
jgi:glycosyltransferase involved in cell wall biosynthesis